MFVWAVWLIMTLAAFYCLAKFTRNIPITEDWLLVPPLTGNEPNLAKWLWAQNNEHRIPVPRLALLALLKISRGDFRAGMMANVIVMSVLSMAMIRVARGMRGGRAKFADAFFPVVLLHLGNWENLFWSWQFGFVFPTALVCTLLMALVRPQNLSSPGGAIIAGICLMLLPLCGANGLLFLPFLAPWFIYYGLVRRPAGKAAGEWERNGRLLIGSALVALFLAGLYAVGYERPAWTPPNPGIAKTVKAATQFSALGFGPVARSAWMISVVAALGILLPGVGVATLGFLRHRGEERRRSSGVLMFFFGAAVFALAMGWARAGVIPIYGSWPIRYVLLAVPALCAVFFAWELYGPEKFRDLMQNGLLLGMCLLIPINTTHGFWWRDWYLKGVDSIERDLAVGISRSELAERHRKFLFHSMDKKELEGFMKMLEDEAIGPFARLRGGGTPIDPVDRPRSEGRQLITRGIRYRILAKEVYLVWGIDGWQAVTEEIRPPGTVIKNSVMHVPMVRIGDLFTATIRAPAGATIDYGFLITKAHGFFESKDAWDGDPRYRMVVSEDGVDDIATTLTGVNLRGWFNRLHIGWYQSIVIGILFSGIWLFRFLRRRVIA